MKDSKTLLLDYLASIGDPERAAALFAKDAVFELPFLRSLGVEPRYTGRGEITAAAASVAQSLPQLCVRAEGYPRPHRYAGERRTRSTWRTRARPRPDARSTTCSPGTWSPEAVRSSCCAKASIRWRWRRHNCRMESPISDRPATKCIRFSESKEVTPMNAQKIYLLAESTVLPGFWKKCGPFSRRLLPRHCGSQAVRPCSRPHDRMIHTSWCSSRSSPLRQRMSGTSNRTIQSGCLHRWKEKWPAHPPSPD